MDGNVLPYTEEEITHFILDNVTNSTLPMRDILSNHYSEMDDIYEVLCKWVKYISSYKNDLITYSMNLFETDIAVYVGNYKSFSVDRVNSKTTDLYLFIQDNFECIGKHNPFNEKIMDDEYS